MQCRQESIVNKYAIVDQIPLSSILSGEKAYRDSKHFFTVLPTTFFNTKTNLHYYIRPESIKQIWLSLKKLVLTTVLPTIKLPCFRTWNYCTSNHSDTGLSNTFYGRSTVLPPRNFSLNHSKQLKNKYRKDVLNYDLKNNIRLDDDFFGMKRRGEISS